MIIATSEEGPGEVSNASNYDGKVITAIPKPVVGGLVAEDLRGISTALGFQGASLSSQA